VAKADVKLRCYWEHTENLCELGERLGNLIGTQWGQQKIKNPFPSHDPKRKKARFPRLHADWLPDIFISKIVGHLFWLGLIHVPKRIGTNIDWLCEKVWILTCIMVGYAWSHIHKLFRFWHSSLQIIIGKRALNVYAYLYPANLP